MATTLPRIKVSVNLRNVVSGAIEVAQTERRNRTARIESAFQRAVASGEMSYQDQISFREEQLEEARRISVVDETLVSSLEVSIGNLRKLARFERIRNKYRDSLDTYVAGRKSISDHISLLEGTIENEIDPDMREQLRTFLSNARRDQATIESNAIKNRATLSLQDRSIPLIDASIQEVTSRRAKASVMGNEDEAATWGETLVALKNSRSKIKIEDSVNEISFRINRYNLKATDKLGLLNEEVSKSDASSPIIFNGVQYTSQRAFWEDKRGEYIRTSYFEEVSREIEAETAKIRASHKFGQVPIARIDAVSNFYNNLKQREEFAPFVDLIEQNRVSKVDNYVFELGVNLQREFDAGLKQAADVKRSEQTFIDLENRFGIVINRKPFVGADAEGTIAESISGEIRAVGRQAQPIAQGINTTGVRTVAEGDSLSRIATDAGVPLRQILDLNPQLQANPNLIRPGQRINLPQAPVTQAPVAQTPTAPVREVAPAPAITPATAPQTPTTAPVVTTQPAATTPATTRNVVVERDETLSSIAQRELGDASRWREIRTEGGQAFDDETAKRLRIGTRLVIPR